MIVLKSCEFASSKKTAIALGSFDAIHRGHIEVITKAVKYARENSLVAAVQVFDVPADLNIVNSFEKRMKILEELGVEVVIRETFDDDFKNTLYGEFVRDYLKERYNAEAVFAGENYRFGKNAQGDWEKLKEECQKNEIKAIIVPCLSVDGVVSSSRIRELIAKGSVLDAAKLMGRPFSTEGVVVHGKGVGRKIGFPTANIEIPKGRVMPGEGVYLSKVKIGEREFYGITNIGAKPTVDEKQKNIETHIHDFAGDLYGQQIEVEFLKRIRHIKRFDSLEELKAQLIEDKKNIPNN